MDKRIRRVRATGEVGDNILSLYLQEINRIPLLTREEEDLIARKVAAGDKAARERLINANLRFVVNVAKKYQGQGLPLQDLIDEGNIGLITAAERFDVEKGYHFISYAVWWIRQAILKAICEKARMIRLPMNRASELIRIERERKALQSGKSVETEIREIAVSLHMTAQHVQDLISISREMVSLDMPLYTDRDAACLGDQLVASNYESPDDYVVSRALREDIESVLRTLHPKEAAVIRSRYGLLTGSSMTLREVGAEFDLTKERIRQIEKKAIRRLKHPKRQKVLANYVA